GKYVNINILGEPVSYPVVVMAVYFLLLLICMICGMIGFSKMKEESRKSGLFNFAFKISAVKVKNGVVTEEFSQLVNPGRPIPSAASAVNHITDDMVAFAPMFDSVLQQFLAFIGDDVLAGHNINRFDMKFLYRDCERYFGQTLTNDYIDTLKLARLCLPELSHHRLGDLAQYYGISTAGAHRALTIAA
ncbi:DNA polymerase III, epsilon subunit, partial [human gut metagenome]